MIWKEAVFTNHATQNILKYLANTYRYVKISPISEQINWILTRYAQSNVFQNSIQI